MDIGAWLRELGLAECAEAFAENGIDAAMLPELNNEDLKDLGASTARRVIEAIGGSLTLEGERLLVRLPA